MPRVFKSHHSQNDFNRRIVSHSVRTGKKKKRVPSYQARTVTRHNAAKPINTQKKEEQETCSAGGWNGLPWDFPALSRHAGTPGAPCLKPPLSLLFHLSAARTCGSRSSPCVSSQHFDPGSEHREVVRDRMNLYRHKGRRVGIQSQKHTHNQMRFFWYSEDKKNNKRQVTGTGHQGKADNKGQSEKYSSNTWVCHFSFQGFSHSSLKTPKCYFLPCVDVTLRFEICMILFFFEGNYYFSATIYSSDQKWQAFIMLQDIVITDKCCYFEISIHQRGLKNVRFLNRII